jgi:hypothetical protein
VTLDLTPFQGRRRLSPRMGLLVDASVWDESHNYHRLQQKLHNLAFHRYGILAGLEVMAWSPAGNSVVVYPGVAMDSEGNVIVVTEPLRVWVDTESEGTSHIVVRYSEVVPASDSSPGRSRQQPAYIQEAFIVEDRRHELGPSDLELARVIIKGMETVIQDAENPLQPSPGEIDTLHRPIAYPGNQGEVRLAVLNTTGAGCHTGGLRNLTRIIDRDTAYHASFIGLVDLATEIDGCDLLHICETHPFSFDDSQHAVLSHFLDRGGILLGEICFGSADEEAPAVVEESFRALASSLGRSMQPATREHPLFRIHHLFSDAPAGVKGTATIMEGDGIIYTDGDYGCLWNGGSESQQASREVIRSALELGINMALYARNRTHNHELKLFGGE